ncbi:TPA: restriction endonuclease subunit S, partial [Pasteurella multocida]|nr:restriction endonuclease subunit S [Pasteurella multocida]
PRLSRISIEKLKIPLPPLATQQKIVDILDKFETLTHSITEGLPKEIELRRKQYEYYREKLLTFPKQ